MKDYCSVYVRNDEEGASCYYRIIQYLNELDAHFLVNNSLNKKEYRLNLDISNGKIKKVFQLYIYNLMLIRLTFYIIRDIIKKPTCVIIQRTILPRYTPLYFNELLKILSKRTILYWDFDDDILSNGEISSRQANTLFKYSTKIIVTNDYLKNKVSLRYRDKVILLPTTDGDFRNIDFDKNKKNRELLFKDEIRLVWVATSSNIPNIIRIIPILDSIAKKIFLSSQKRLLLYVVCNRPVYIDTECLIIKNINWTRKDAQDMIMSSHIGLMPLQYSEYALGKGGFKLIQYIATGLPVVGSKVGFNSSVIREGSGVLVDDLLNTNIWESAIFEIISDWERWEKYSIAAYNQWEKEFSYNENLLVWEKLILQK